MKLFFQRKTNFPIFHYKNIIFGSIFICWPFFMVLFSLLALTKRSRSKANWKRNRTKQKANNKIHTKETLNGSVHGRYYYLLFNMNDRSRHHQHFCRRSSCLSNFTFDFYFIIFFCSFLSPFARRLWLSAFKQHLCWYRVHIPRADTYLCIPQSM